MLPPWKFCASLDTSLRLRANTNEELGCIRYSFSSLEDARREAALSRKPILAINVDIPGNVTIEKCILSDPLIVEAAESLFVPVQFRLECAPGVNISMTKFRIQQFAY
jgi:hypothetical protein